MFQFWFQKVGNQIKLIISRRMSNSFQWDHIWELDLELLYLLLSLQNTFSSWHSQRTSRLFNFKKVSSSFPWFYRVPCLSDSHEHLSLLNTFSALQIITQCKIITNLDMVLRVITTMLTKIEFSTVVLVSSPWSFATTLKWFFTTLKWMSNTTLWLRALESTECDPFSRHCNCYCWGLNGLLNHYPKCHPVYRLVKHKM